MNKREFEKFVISNLEDIECIRCDLVEGFDDNNEISLWVDVCIKSDEYTSVYCSDYFPLDSKEVRKLWSTWKKKLDTWVNPNWGIKVISEHYTV